MLSRKRILLTASIAGIAAAGLAREVGVGNTLRLIAPTSFMEHNGYRFEAPISSDTAPTIFVFSDDKLRYSRIGYHDKKLHFRVTATQECLGDRWTQSGVPIIRIGKGGWPSSGGGKPIPQPEAVPYKLAIDVPLEDLRLPAGFDPVKRCNTVIQDYTLSGKRPGALLQQGYWIKVDGVVPASLSPSCAYHEKRRVGFGSPPQLPPGVDTKFPVFLRCMPTGYVETRGVPPRPGKPLSDYPSIKSISLTAVNSPVTHSCPATVIFKGQFEAGRAIKGRYRFVGSDNYTSAAYPYALAAGAKKSVTWQRRIELPNTTGNMTMGGGTSWPRRVTGWLMLDVMVDEPNAQSHRSRVGYEVRCQKP
jgi:hypothetical protein